jgi:tRNA(Arg) A34 adenosine deaminase TadA
VNTDEFMRRAVALSREKMRANSGGPFGALVMPDRPDARAFDHMALRQAYG